MTHQGQVTHPRSHSQRSSETRGNTVIYTTKYIFFVFVLLSGNKLKLCRFLSDKTTRSIFCSHKATLTGPSGRRLVTRDQPAQSRSLEFSTPPPSASITCWKLYLPHSPEMEAGNGLITGHAHMIELHKNPSCMGFRELPAQ